MLDFSQVATQIRSFVGEHARSLPRLHAALQEAEARLESASMAWESTRDKIEVSRTSWLLADWYEPPDRICEAPARPMPHTALAADGSQIVSDRHDIALCYLLNIGRIALRYGRDERPTLHSQP